MKITTRCLGLWIAALLSGQRTAAETAFELSQQRRDPQGRAVRETGRLVPGKTAVVVVDMWDRHWCKTYTARVANLVPRMNQTLEAVRKLGVQVVWAPSDVVGFYQNHPARKAMLAIPAHPTPTPVPFNPPQVPQGDHCECGPDRPCRNASVWTRQQPGLHIMDGDLIADCNNVRELLDLCAERGLDTLIYMGVASNMCVCYRSMGMISARRNGFRVIFVADLVESIMANGIDPTSRAPDPNFTPAKGTALVQRFLEQHVAASIESRELLAAAATSMQQRSAALRRPLTRPPGTLSHPMGEGRGEGNRTVEPADASEQGDPRPHVVFVIADDEYKSEQTLPAFARENLGKDFRCTFCLAQGNATTNRNDVSGLEALYDADLLVLSMRRRALPVTQMDFLERYLRSGKPVVALRVSVVPFQVEPEQRPNGHVVWRDFDQEVLGCQYRGYSPEARQTGTEVWVVPEARNHPVLRGLEDARFHSAMWIYRVKPLAASAQVLLSGQWSEKAPEEPVAWTNSQEGSRVFYTCLGHPDDFAIPAFQRLLLNAIRWGVAAPQ